MPNSKPKPFVLIILDGWGHCDNLQHNPTLSTPTPTIDQLWAEHPHTLLSASGTDVGLPKGQIGNSEVGHLHLGAGRKLPQDLTRIDDEIASGNFFEHPVLNQALQTATRKHRAVHVLGLLSPGGVHSHQNHIFALIKLMHRYPSVPCYVHGILDGRDVPPQSAMASIADCETALQTLTQGKIASIIGRYYAMDRDHRWKRTQAAYELFTSGTAAFHASNAQAALSSAYLRGETDEFVQATAIHHAGEQPITIKDDDVIIFMNFRADRARQITRAFVTADFAEFDRQRPIRPSEFLTLTEYAADLNTQVIYPPLSCQHTLGEWLSQHGLRQLRIAETEKYAHVTYFFNGGNETPFPLENRELIPSPKVATYDLQPEMSARGLTQALIKAIAQQTHDVIICNYANPDMVGHTGIETAASDAVKVIDHCLKEVLSALRHVGGEALITADHGNIETMFDQQTQQPHTAHTTNKVPLFYIGRSAQFVIQDGALDDVAPTLLYLLGLSPPPEMTGRNLLRLND